MTDRTSNQPRHGTLSPRMAAISSTFLAQIGPYDLWWDSGMTSYRLAIVSEPLESHHTPTTRWYRICAGALPTPLRHRHDEKTWERDVPFNWWVEILAYLEQQQLWTP